MTLPNIEIPAAIREMGEKSVQQMQAACSELQKSSEQSADVLEKAVESVTKSMVSLQAQSMDAIKANMANGFDLMKSLLNSKSPSELMEACTSFSRQQMDLAMAQSKTVQDISAKAAADVAKLAQEGAKVIFTSVKDLGNVNKVA